MSTRHTSQRRAIFAVIRDAPGPLRPAAILELASRKVPSLGIATVYRNLKRLQELGEVRVVELGASDVRYEPTDRDHQYHLLCRECGQAFDIRVCPGGISKLAPPGFEIDEHKVIFYGRCSQCRTEMRRTYRHHE